MKNLKQFIFATIGLLLFASMPINGVAKAFDLSAMSASAVVAGAAAILYIASRFQSNRTGYVAGIQVEIWVDYIIERLFKDNAFLNYAWNDDDKVLAGKVVHIPNPGARPTVVKNRSSFPATTVQRTDTDITYPLDEFTTDPTHIQNAEMVETSYNKIESVLGDHIGYLTQDVADNLILRWLDESVTSPVKLYTTGADTAATAPAATGTRKALTTGDLRRCQLAMNVANIPRTERYFMPSANMLDQLISSLTETQYRDFSSVVDPKEGILGRLYGFTILDRSNVAIASSTNVIKAFGAAGAVGDNEVSIAWHKNSVSRAKGDVMFFEKLNDPQFYGNVYSALLRMGGRRRRSDDKGVIALIQAA